MTTRRTRIARRSKVGLYRHMAQQIEAYYKEILGHRPHITVRNPNGQLIVRSRLTPKIAQEWINGDTPELRAAYSGVKTFPNIDFAEVSHEIVTYLCPRKGSNHDLTKFTVTSAPGELPKVTKVEEMQGKRCCRPRTELAPAFLQELGYY